MVPPKELILWASIGLFSSVEEVCFLLEVAFGANFLMPDGVLFGSQ